MKALNIDDQQRRERFTPQSKSTIIKNKCALRCLAGQERMCRMSGMARRITPQLRSRDQDTHRVLKVTLQPWPTLFGMRSLIDYTTKYKVGKTYFRADWFCKYDHDNLRKRKAIRQRALDRAENTNDGPVLPVLQCEAFVYKRYPPRTLAQINATLVTGSSNSLFSSSLPRLSPPDRGVTLRSRFW